MPRSSIPGAKAASPRSATRRGQRCRSSSRAASVGALLLTGSAWACGSGSGQLESPLPDGGTAPDGAAGAAGAAGASAGCVPGAAAENARITAPSPLLSVGAPIVAASTVTGAEALVDGRYHSGNAHGGFGVPDPNQPPWVAIDVGAGPTRLLLAWHDPGWGAYDVLSGGAPVAYRIETSADSTDGSDGTWGAAVTVTDNPVRARGHGFDFAGQRWVRFTVTEGSLDSSGEAIAVRLDEIAIHDVSAAGTAVPEDTWFFLGDSITAGAFRRDLGAADFPGSVGLSQPGFDPIVIGGGIGGEFASDGAARVDEVLALCPDFEHVGIAYGTNDSWGNGNPASVDFEAHWRTMIESVLAAGAVPILARIPYAATDHPGIDPFNQIIDELQAQYGLPCGPDLFTWFSEHPDELSDDGVHPNRTGYESINRLWAEAVAPLYEAP